jgi:hypothetical protein
MHSPQELSQPSWATQQEVAPQMVQGVMLFCLVGRGLWSAYQMAPLYWWTDSWVLSNTSAHQASWDSVRWRVAAAAAAAAAAAVFGC